MQSAYEPSNVRAMAVAKRVDFSTAAPVAIAPQETFVPDTTSVPTRNAPLTSPAGMGGGGAPPTQPPQSLFEIFIYESKLLRWRLVPLMGILGFGTFYNLDIPGAIGMGDGDTIQSRFIAAHLADLGSNSTDAFASGFSAEDLYTNAMNQRLYSLNYYPNIVVPLVSGILVDRVIGPRNATILFCAIVTLGSFIFATGVTYVNYNMMMIGRFIIGLASETTMILRSYYVSRFFKRGSDIRGVALAFGLAVGCSRMGSVVTFPMTVAFAGIFGVPTACYAGTLASLFTLGCGMLLNHYDAVAEDYGMVPQQAHLIAKAKERETREQTRTLKRLTRPMSLQSIAITPGATSRTESLARTPVHRRESSLHDFNNALMSVNASRNAIASGSGSGIGGLGSSGSDHAMSTISPQKTPTGSRSTTPRKRRSSSTHAPMSPVCAEPKVQEALAVMDDVEMLDTSIVVDDEDEESGLMKLWNTLADRFHPKRFKKLNIAFWTACLASNFFFPAIFPFFAFAKPFFEVRWGISESTAVIAIAVYQSASVIGCPTFGLLSDSIGRNSVMLAVGSAGAFCMHFLLATTTTISPILILLCYGTFHGIFVGGFQPTPALLVNPEELGLAFGVIGALNCLGVSIAPAVVGYILDQNTKHVVLPSGDVTTKTDVEGYISAEYVLLSFVAVSVIMSIAFLIADHKVLQGVVFASPAERVEIFRLKDAAHADAAGKEKEEMEQRIRDAADALMTAFNQVSSGQGSGQFEADEVDEHNQTSSRSNNHSEGGGGGGIVDISVKRGHHIMEVEDTDRKYSFLSVEQPL